MLTLQTALRIVELILAIRLKRLELASSPGQAQAVLAEPEDALLGCVRGIIERHKDHDPS